MNESPGFWQAIIAALQRFGQQGNVDERGATAKAASQGIAQQLPAAVMPHEAIEAQRQKQALIDAMLRGEQ